MMCGNGKYTTADSSGEIATASFTTLPSTDTEVSDGAFEIAAENTTGDGAGATVTVTVTTGVFTAAITKNGSGYDALDKLFIGAQDIADAFNTDVENVDKDIEISITSISTFSANTFQGFTRSSSSLDIDFTNSNVAALGTFNLYFVVGAAGAETTKQTYKVEGCCVNEAAIDFDIEGITTINWSGMGTLISDYSATDMTATITEGAGATDTSNFIRNRLTSLAIGNSTTDFDLVLTGGSISINNNISFITPETLGVVNQPFAHVTGNRTVGGSFTCYLNGDGDTGSAKLFEGLIEGTTDITNSHVMEFKVGGNNAPRLEFDIPKAHLEIPTHSIEDIISLEVNFHALPSDIEGADEIAVKYVGT